MISKKQNIENFKKLKKQEYNTDYYVSGILSGNKTILSKAITLIESNLEKHQNTAQQIIEKCLPYSGNSMRIGITGIPGVGKSTFIETFGNYITQKNRRLCVLAIDPSSEQSKGSILGDKTRMETLSTNKNAFIRPSPTSGTLGGVARRTREIIILCEAAGFDTILIETVGVGQSETLVNSMVDFFMLLMIAGAGDELQGIKRGIMEMADNIIFTKADGNNMLKSKLAKTQFESALHYFPKKESNWTPTVSLVSALENVGIEEVWQTTENYFNTIKNNNFLKNNRKEQTVKWLHETIMDKLKADFYKNKFDEIKKLEQKTINSELTPYIAVKQLFEQKI